MPWVVLTTATLVLLAVFEPRLGGNGRMGADYSAFLPRLLANAYWFRLNGWWSVPWFSPAFCGGMPDWAGPQSMPYSFPQWMTSVFGPVAAVRITYGVFAALGATGTWTLLRSAFRVSAPAALVGAVLFLFNGFYTREMIVGHLSFHTIMLIPWVAWLLLQKRRSRWGWLVDGTLAGALIGLMIHGGMVALLVPVGLSWIALAMLHGLRGGDPWAFAVRLSVAVSVGAALSASKLVAMAAFASQFPRDFYPLGGFSNPLDLLAGLLRTLFYRVGNSYGKSATHFAVTMQADEWENGLTPVPLFILAAALLRRVRCPAVVPARGRVWMIAVLVAACTVPLAVCFYSPGWNAFLKQLPILKSTVMTLRWFVLYVPVVVVLTALAFDRLQNRALVAGLAIVGVATWTSLFTVRSGKDAVYNPKFIQKGWDSLHIEGRVPTIQYIDLPANPDGSLPSAVYFGDDDVALGGNQVLCYDPIFGYAHEANPLKGLHAGSPLDQTDGLLNLKNPVCELYPVENHCRPGDQFRAGDSERAAAFLDWGPLEFERPLRQRLADVVNLLAVVGVLGLLLGLLIQSSRRTAVAARRGRQRSGG